eukprot:1160541-Pelagomonas_calceolata.AAC.4
MKTCSAAESAAETHWPISSTAAAAAAQWEGASGSFLFLAVDTPPALQNSCPKRISRTSTSWVALLGVRKGAESGEYFREGGEGAYYREENCERCRLDLGIILAMQPDTQPDNLPPCINS